MPIKNYLEASCVRNFRNPLFAKLLLFEILGHFQKLFWAKILGVRNFRVFEILGHLPYPSVEDQGSSDEYPQHMLLYRNSGKKNIKSTADLLKCVLILRWIFYNFFLQLSGYFEKHDHTVR